MSEHVKNEDMEEEPILTCPHCGVQASKARYNGYHGANCASIKL